MFLLGDKSHLQFRPRGGALCPFQKGERTEKNGVNVSGTPTLVRVVPEYCHAFKGGHSRVCLTGSTPGMRQTIPTKENYTQIRK
jgi:hypothetical protein